MAIVAHYGVCAFHRDYMYTCGVAAERQSKLLYGASPRLAGQVSVNQKKAPPQPQGDAKLIVKNNTRGTAQ